jgi:hypothetical protein
LNFPIAVDVLDYPLVEYTLGEAFLHATRGFVEEDEEEEETYAAAAVYRNDVGVSLAEQWFNSHFDHFIGSPYSMFPRCDVAFEMLTGTGSAIIIHINVKFYLHWTSRCPTTSIL